MKKSLGAKTFALPAPVWLLGSYDEAMQPDMMTVSWGGICASEPPALAVSVKKTRRSYENIHRRKSFTINVPSQKQRLAVDFAGMVSGRDEDKFARVSYTAEPGHFVEAPLILECPLTLECRLLWEIELGSHVQLIGEILDTAAELSVLDEKDIPQMKAIDPILSSPAERAYYSLGNYLEPAYLPGSALLHK